MSAETHNRRQTDWQPEDRREAGGDRRGSGADRRQGPRRNSEAAASRARELMMRYRQPLLGLGLVGAAMPLVRQQQQQDGTQDATPAAAPGSDHAVAAASRNDAEEDLAERIGASRAEDERTRYVQAAVADYGIAADLAGDIFDIAREENVDPDVALGLVRTESTFNERAVSHVGARGLTQVMPRTARGIIPGTTTDQLFERKTNLRLGFRYLDQLMQKYRGNEELALTAYNRGPGTVDKVLKRGGNPDNGYAGKVLRGS